ncbi:GILT-like protein C02D5.2 [Toxocara canis]|uniref:GILT-like protein C02D5.2 n=1 Tax=Toxocara canis TaxID=6265 RepID=A0A0B2W5D5_TOXCA|nr:GILT-like protein C02D5.2 [Toxocara canis]
MWSAAATFIVIAAIAAVNSQMVNVTLFTEAQCKYCTKLFREQLWPFYTQHPGVMNLQVVAFGKGNCELYPDRKLHCYCMHGPTECDLDRLQNCAIYFFPRHYFGLLVCIQGLRDLREAFDRCISRLSPQTQQKLIECSTSQSGEILNYQSMLMTHRAGE